jgi:hypothetical protein
MKGNYTPSRQAFINENESKNLARRNRKLRKWINKDRISYAIEKARNSAIKAKCNGFTPLDLSRHIPKEKQDGTSIKLVQWKDSPVDLQASMYQLALAEIEATTEKVLIPFVFRISETLIDKAHKSTDYGTAAYVYKRLKDSLRRTLKRADNDLPEFWFSFELAKKKHYHIQGAIALYPHEVKNKTLARKAFYKIAGEMSLQEKSKSLRFRHGRRKRLIEHRGQLAVDLNWALYNTKERFEIQAAQFREWQDNKAGSPIEEPIKIGHRQSLVSVSNSLTGHAKRLHDDLLNNFNTNPYTAALNDKWGSW